MAYKPVPTSQKICVHCNTVYYAKDQRRMYCSSSCNTKAWMARHGLSGSDQSQIKPKQAGGTLDWSLPNLGLMGAAVLAADATKAGLNAIFEVQPTNREVMDKLESVEQMLLSIQRGQAITRIEVGQTKGLVADVVHGVAATGNDAQKAIVGSQRLRGLKGSKPKPTGDPKPPKVDTAGR